MKISAVRTTGLKIFASATLLIAFSAPALAQNPGSQSQPGSPMPMGQMMQAMHHGRMGPMQGMMGGPGRGMMSRFSPEDMTAFLDARIAAVHAGLKLSAEQEKLWPPVESAIRDLATLHMSHMQAMRESRGAMAGDRIAMVRALADRMSQGADALRKLADAAAPLYASLDESQKRRLQVLAPMSPRGLMGPGRMMNFGGGMMGGWSGNDEDETDEDTP